MSIKIQGEQFSKQMQFTNSGTSYSNCDQIIIVIYKDKTFDNKLYFVKNVDSEYPDANLLIYENELIELFFDTNTTKKLEEGKYLFEIMRVINGEKMPIIKSTSDIFQIIKTNI